MRAYHVLAKTLLKACVIYLLIAGQWPTAAATGARQLVLARSSQALATIAIDSTNCIPAEKTAAQELATYLARITGATFAISDEKDLAADAPAIYVGDTQFARVHGIDSTELGAEESILRTIDKNLILTGGRPRGTLYAVYELLENTLGCRWYTPWAEKAPIRTTLTIPALDKRVKPYMQLREGGVTFWRDERTFFDLETYRQFRERAKWWTVRNRINGSYNRAGLGEDVGGYVKSGGRCASHSLFAYVPAAKYGKDHPEYFSERNGKRTPSLYGNDGNQLCLTNPDVLRIVIAGVKEDIRANPDGYYYSVSINDGGSATICDCAKCRAVVREEGESGLLLQFVNAVADAIKKDYPDKYILTLAYTSTQFPPKRIQARDNVIIWVCRGARSSAVYLPRGANAHELQALRDWPKFAKHIWVWDYATASFHARHYFTPMMWKMDEQFKLFKKLGTVDGIFQDNSLLVFDEMFPQFVEMHGWIYDKLCQDPSLDLNILMDDFLNGYYGKAGPYLRRYINLIHARLPQFPYRMFDFTFVSRAQRCFDKAEAAVKDRPELLGRVKDLRIQLDLITVAHRNHIIADYLRRGRSLETYPYRIAVLKERILTTLQESQHPCFLTKVPRYTQDKDGKETSYYVPMLDVVRRYTTEICSGREYSPLPEQFRSLPRERVIDLTAPLIAGGVSPVVTPDPEAALGLAVPRWGGNELKMPIGIYSHDPATPQNLSRDIGVQDIPGKGYHLYRGPSFTIGEWTFVHLTRSWMLQEHLCPLFDTARPRRKWDVYVSAKFTGSAYPHGDKNEPNGLYIDRVILVRGDDEQQVQTKESK